MKTLKSKTSPIKFLAVSLFVVFGLIIALSSGTGTLSGAQKSTTIIGCSSNTGACKTSEITLTDSTTYACGSGTSAVITSINFGCYGNECQPGGSGGGYCNSSNNNSAIIDFVFAIIRFLSKGVGLVVIGSVIVGGVQYIGSRGEPNATSIAIDRIRSSVVALVIFVFAYAILNYVIPAGFFN